MKVLGIILILIIVSSWTFSQRDSVTAEYIKTLVDRIENRIQLDLTKIRDTVINDKDGPIKIQTKYFIDPVLKQVEKIVEKSSFNQFQTEITVYYRMEQALFFTTTQSENSKIKVDVDCFYLDNNPVYYVKRKFDRGNPDMDEILNWCKDMLRQYSSK